MKIESKLNSLTDNLKSDYLNPDQGFEQFINSPAKQTTGSDYYWQHQQQLQQSDLSFNELTFQINTTPKELRDNEPFCKQDVTQSKTVLNQPILRAMQQFQPEHTSSTDFELNDLIVSIKNAIKTQDLFSSNEITRQIVSKNSQQQEINNQKISDQTTFKNHQLFINNKSAELSLNTTQLSKHQTAALKILIKQWLNNKGLALKQLIINGEYQ